MILLQKTPSTSDSTEIGFVIEDGKPWWDMYDEFRRFLLAVGYEYDVADVVTYLADTEPEPADDDTTGEYDDQ